MKAKWKYTALFTLLIIGAMQVLPFLPTHTSCEAACCVEAVTCCETGVSTGCEMAMTSCSVSLFVPLISAPLIKVESTVHLDIALAPYVSNEIIESQQHVDHVIFIDIAEAPPPDYLPLLI